jgi:hypothetical protein
MEQENSQNKNEEVLNLPQEEKMSVSERLFLFSKKHKKAIIVFLLSVVIIGGLLLSRITLFAPKFSGQFNVVATKFDKQGISPDSGFILYSRKYLSDGDVKKYLKFNPEVGFSIKKLAENKSIFNAALAAEENSGGVVFSYEIKPELPLDKNKIISVSLNDPEVADHDYGWAFQIKAPFSVLKVHPRDKGTEVPINSGIEVTFNREKVISPEKYFEINPQAKGSFEYRGSTLIFKPDRLDSNKVYQVTIKKGLQAEGSNELMEKDFVFSFETGLQEGAKNKPYFTIQNDFSQMVPGKNPIIEVSASEKNLPQLNADVYKFMNGDDFVSSYKNSRNWSLQWSNSMEGIISEEAKNKTQKISSFNPEIKKVDWQQFFEVPGNFDDGYYMVDVSMGDQHYGAWIQITPVFHYSSVTEEKSLLWIYDYAKKSPINDLKISFLTSEKKAEELGKTDGEGLLEFKTPEEMKSNNEDEESSPDLLKIEKDGYLPVYLAPGLEGSASEGDRYWDHLSTDRYTYQMSDTVKFWGILKGRNEDLKQKKVSVGIYGGEYDYLDSGSLQEQALVKKDVLISQFDSFSGELNFKGFSPGYYSIKVFLGDKEVSQNVFEVLTYSKPAYQISVTPDKTECYAGDTVNFKIKTNFFDGTPVSGLELKYNADWDGIEDGEIKLDQNGEASLSFVPGYFEDEYYPSGFELNVSPKLSEEGEIYGTGNVSVFGPNIYLDSSQKKSENGDYKFTAKANKIILGNSSAEENSSGYDTPDYVGDPVTNLDLTAEIIKITNIRVQDGEYYDYIEKVMKPKYHYENSEEKVEEINGSTDGNGEWSFSRNFSENNPNIRYKVVFKGKDSGNRKIEDTSYVFNYSFGDVKDFSISLVMESDKYDNDYSIGDKVSLDLKTLEGSLSSGAKILYYRYQNDIDKAEISDSMKYEENFEEKFAPSVKYRAVVFGPQGFEQTNSVSANFRKEDKKLDISINADKDFYKPRDNVNLDFSVKDKEGKPVSAEINVSAVDEAIFHILPYNWQIGILESLYREIYTDPVTSASNISQWNDSAEQGGCFGKGTEILLSDGKTKPIEDIRVGDVIVTLKSEKSDKKVEAVVQGVSSHYVSEYLVINDSLEVTPEHRLFVNGEWKEAGRIQEGDTLIGKNGENQKINSISIVRGSKIPVYNIIVGTYHTYFANGLYVHNEEKGGNPRIDFIDTAAFKNIQADSSGQAKMDFKVPDNLTSWRVTAQAFDSKSMKAGEKIKMIKTTLPFFVDSTLGKIYLKDDEPRIRLRAYGTEYQNGQETEFSIKSDSLGISDTQKSIGNFAYFSLGDLKEGEHEILISAKQGDKKDSMIRKIKVVGNYFRQVEANKYDLENVKGEINGNREGLTKLVFSDSDRGRFFEYLSGASYISSIRLENSVAHFFANDLLSKYFSQEAAEPLNLEGYYSDKNGLGLFPYYGDSDLEVSAKVADVAGEYVYKDRLKGYFEDEMTKDTADIQRISKALYGLASLGDPVLVKINAVLERPEINFEDKLFLNLALAKLGEKEKAREFFIKEVRLKLETQGEMMSVLGETDKDKKMKTTALVAMLASYTDVSPDTEKLWNYISSNDFKTDLIELEKIALVKTELSRSKEEEAKFSYSTNKRNENINLGKGEVYSVVLSWDELKDIKFSDIKGKISLVSYWEKSKDPKDLTLDQNMKIERAYFSGDKPAQEFKEGDLVKIKLNPKINNIAQDGSYQIIDYLPSGLRPITQTYSAGISSENNCDPLWYPDKIENNIVYFRIDKGFEKTNECSSRSLNYFARVVSTGSFSANPAVIQSLGNTAAKNISSSEKIEIK